MRLEFGSTTKKPVKRRWPVPLCGVLVPGILQMGHLDLPFVDPRSSAWRGHRIFAEFYSSSPKILELGVDIVLLVFCRTKSEVGVQ
jgi:hypothetical protein